MLCTMVIAAMALWLVHTTLMPAFAGVQPATKGRALSVIQRGASSWYDDIEVMVTIPNIGQRTRIEVTKEKKVDEVKKEARVLLGLTQDFLKDEDFHMYFARDESIELDPKAKLGDYPDLYKPWSPDGFEIHMRYEPRQAGPRTVFGCCACGLAHMGARSHISMGGSAAL